MAGLGDTLKGMILGNTPAGKVSGAMNSATLSNNNGHTTSGIDSALSAHADKIHPVDNRGRMPLPSDDNSFNK